MNRSTAVMLVASALSVGCAAGTGLQFLPDVISLSRTSNAYADVGSMHSERELLTTVSPILARYGYFITDRKPAGNGLRLLTDWKVQPVPEDDIFDGVQRARTRLIVDARQRGNRYAVTIYAVNFVQDETGTWRDIGATADLRRHVRQIGTEIAGAVR